MNFPEWAPRHLVERYNRYPYRSEFGLPPEIGKELLEKLIRDLRMPTVWASLSRRIKEEVESLYFWEQCETAILEWWGSHKRSPKGHEEHFLKIHYLALELSRAINETEEFQNYSTAEILDAEALKSW